MNVHKTGMVAGLFLGVIHLVWSFLVYLKVAQGVLDFIFTLHSLSNPITVLPFNVIRCGVLVLMTFVAGYIFGILFAFIWNRFHKSLLDAYLKY